MSHLCASFAVVAALTGMAAHAGRRPFTSTLDTETVLDGAVELEADLSIRSQPRDALALASYQLGWGPHIGLSSQLELALPIYLLATRSATALEGFEIDGRFRLLPMEDDSRLQ